MNKAYLLVICLLLAPFTGCIEPEEIDITSEPVEDQDNSQIEETKDESDNTVDETNNTIDDTNKIRSSVGLSANIFTTIGPLTFTFARFLLGALTILPLLLYFEKNIFLKTIS